MIIQLFLIIVYLYSAIRITKTNLFLRSLLLFIVALYGLQLVLAIEDPYHYYHVSSLTLLLFNLQIIFILIGIRIGLRQKPYTLVYDSNRIFTIRITKAVLVLQSLLLLLSILRYKKMQAFVLSNLASMARDYYFTDLYDSYSEMFLYNVADAFIYVSFFLAFSLLLFRSGKGLKEWYIIISTALIIVLKTLTSLGRGVIVQMFIVFLLFFLYSYRENKRAFKKTVKPISIGLASIVTVVFLITTLSRFDLEGSDFIYDNWDELLLKPFATYFYVPICAFDYGKERIFNDLIPMMGAADLAAPIDFLLTPIQFINHDIVTMNNTLGLKMSPQFSFPSGETWNALFTGASNYYIDFGFLGFIIFPLFHGLILAKLSNKCKSSGAWFSVLVFFFLASFNHMKSSEIQSMSTVFTFFWIYYVSKTKVITR